MFNTFTASDLKKTALAAILTAGACVAHADLVRDPSIQVQGSGLGAVNTLVTISDGSTPQNPTIESGCVSSTGGATFDFSCLNGLQGGDNQAINQTRLLSTISSTDAGDLGLVVNIAETGQDLTVTLTDLYLSLYSLSGALLGNFQYTGPDVDLTQGTGTGIGGSGFVFVLDAAQQAMAEAACPVLTNCFIGGGVQFANGSTNNGPETLYVISVANGGGPPNQIPEPGSLALAGLALLGVVAATRRRPALAARRST
jgi:hypothetical protein